MISHQAFCKTAASAVCLHVCCVLLSNREWGGPFVGICKEYKVIGLAVCYEFYPRNGRGSRICVPFVPIRAIVPYRSQLKPPRLRSSASGGLPGFLFFDDADCDGCQRRTSRVSFLRCCRLRWVPGQRRCAQRPLSHPSLSSLTNRPFPAQHHAAGRHLDNGLLAASLNGHADVAEAPVKAGCEADKIVDKVRDKASWHWPCALPLLSTVSLSLSHLSESKSGWES